MSSVRAASRLRRAAFAILSAMACAAVSGAPSPAAAMCGGNVFLSCPKPKTAAPARATRTKLRRPAPAGTRSG